MAYVGNHKGITELFKFCVLLAIQTQTKKQSEIDCLETTKGKKVRIRIL